ncbi:MAG: phosphate ABC transporter substrate-binding protein, partial [Anaerotignum sp.]|nr:phosphate ABC transporter substrate-binding protein [Anaerotignum sp.]
MKKFLTLGLAMTMLAGALTGCGGSDTQAETAGGAITVVSREDGSGTRGAFIELFGIEEKNEAGEKIDMTTDMAEITNSTAVMMTTVAGNTAAIGYVSLGSLNDSV